MTQFLVSRITEKFKESTSSGEEARHGEEEKGDFKVGKQKKKKKGKKKREVSSSSSFGSDSSFEEETVKKMRPPPVIIEEGEVENSNSPKKISVF